MPKEEIATSLAAVYRNIAMNEKNAKDVVIIGSGSGGYVVALTSIGAVSPLRLWLGALR